MIQIFKNLNQYCQGSDSSGNGLSNSMETSELCFYTEMGWLGMLTFSNFNRIQKLFCRRNKSPEIPNFG